MKMNRQIALGMSLFLLGCGGGEKSKSSREFQVLSDRVSSIASTNVVSGRKCVDLFTDVCTGISTLTNQDERITLLRNLSQAMQKDPTAYCSERERDEIVNAFLHPHEYMAYHLLKAGASEQEVGDFIIEEFKRFRTLCHPFGEYDPVAQGDTVIRDERQRMAKNLDWQWRNDAGFFERVSIRTIFHSAPSGAKERFLQRWHDEFGCFDSSHKGK